MAAQTQLLGYTGPVGLDVSVAVHAVLEHRGVLLDAGGHFGAGLCWSGGGRGGTGFFGLCPPCRRWRDDFAARQQPGGRAGNGGPLGKG